MKNLVVKLEIYDPKNKVTIEKAIFPISTFIKTYPDPIPLDKKTFLLRFKLEPFIVNTEEK